MSEAKSFEEQMAGLGTAGEYLGKALDANVRVIDYIAHETQPLWEPVGKVLGKAFVALEMGTSYLHYHYEMKQDVLPSAGYG